MPSFFKQVSQIQSRADYDKLLRKALAPDSVTEGVGPTEEFHYFEEFPFDKRPGTLVLVGDISKALLGDLKKLGSGYARGTCRLTPNKRVLVDIETGRVKPKLINGALKTSGLKLQAVVNGEDPEPDPELSAELSEEVPTSTPPEAPTPTKAPSSSEQQLWMEKVKVLRPAFDKALQLARTSDPRWAEDLDSNFAQMMQEARTGDFEAAIETLKRLAIILRSREAARAEVKHQTNKEDRDYAEGVRQQVEGLQTQDREMPGLRQESERQLEEAGQGLTSDGTTSYVKAITPGEWKSGVTEPLMALAAMIKDTKPRDLSFDALMQKLEGLSQLLARAHMLAREEEDRPELGTAGFMLERHTGELQEALEYLARRPGSTKLQPGNMVAVLAEVNNKLRSLLIAKSQEVLMLGKQPGAEQTPERIALRKDAEREVAEQEMLMSKNLSEVRGQAYEISEAMRVLRRWRRPHDMEEGEFQRRTEENRIRLEDLEEDDRQLAKTINDLEESLVSSPGGARPSGYSDVCDKIDFKTLKLALDRWNAQFEPLKKHLRAAEWAEAHDMVTEVINAINASATEQPHEIQESLGALTLEMVGLQTDCYAAQRAAASSPTVALNALKQLIKSCSEFQRLYFK